MKSVLSKLPTKWLIVALAVIAILASAAIAVKPDDRLHVSFLNVGQGDAILIQKGSQQVLIDGGPSPQAINLALSSQMPFWDRTIELVVLTHPHADHITGQVEVLNNYRVEQVLYPDLDNGSPAYEEWLNKSPLYKEWLNLLKEKDVRYTLAQAGQQIDLGGGAIIKVLNPETPQITGTESDIDTDIDNNGSLVLCLSLGRVSFLLTGDLMAEGELELISRRAIPECTVLKVAHHGSDTSTSPGFLAVASPQIAVISVGADNDYGLPGDEIIQRLEEELGAENIYRTDVDGTIEFITDGERLWVEVGE